MSDRERLEDRRRRRMALLAFTTVLVAASVFVISDAYFDLSEAPPDLLTVLEAAVAVALVFGSFLGIAELRRNHRLLDSHEEALAAASGALAEVIEAQFAEWRLTPAEREIGMLALKGFDIAEIAQLRGAAQGTVRAQMTSIYAKSGTSGRAQFAAFFVEDLLAGSVGGSDRPVRAAREAAE